MRKLTLYFRLKKLYRDTRFWTIWKTRKREDKKTYEQLFQDMQLDYLRSMDDRAIFKDLLTTRIIVLLKQMTFLKEKETDFNRARLFELTQIKQLIDKIDKEASNIKK